MDHLRRELIGSVVVLMASKKSTPLLPAFYKHSVCAYWLDTDPSLVCCHYRNEILILFDGMLHCQLASSSNSQYGCLISLEIVTIVVRRDTHSSF